MVRWLDLREVQNYHSDLPPHTSKLVGAPSLSQSQQELLVLLGEGGGREKKE